jgi:hypothetical protein
MRGTKIITVSAALVACAAIASAQHPAPRRGGSAGRRSQTGISVALSLDHAVYPATAAGSAEINAQFTVRNTSPDAVTFTLPTTQIYDMEIKDAKGNVVFRWSAGKMFGQIVTTLDLTQELDYTIAAPLAKLSAGQYVAQAWLTVEGPERAYSASVAFSIQ